MAVFPSRQIVVPVRPWCLGDYAVGESVFLNVNGTLKEFIVVNQGIPSGSSLYDSSCDETWLLMKELYVEYVWSSSDSHNYKNSTSHTYLNNTFLNRLDADVQEAICQVKIPYQTDTSDIESVASGSSGLSTKIFLLSGKEVGFPDYNMSEVTEDGAKLDYFITYTDASNYSQAKALRKAFYNGSEEAWWTRSMLATTKTHLCVDSDGGDNSVSCTAEDRYLRPAFIMPQKTRFDPDTNQFKGV